MNKVLITAPLLVALAAMAMPAAAADKHRYRDDGRDRHGYYHRGRDDGHRSDRDERRAYYHGYRDGYRDDRRHSDWDGDRYYYRNVYVYPRYRPAYPRTVVHRYVGPPPWARGRDYRSYGYRNVYYVPYVDYRRYGLYDPGYGRHWMRDDAGNFLLIVAATGIIASILDN